jgi:hypothetical protein
LGLGSVEGQSLKVRCEPLLFKGRYFREGYLTKTGLLFPN